MAHFLRALALSAAIGSTTACAGVLGIDYLFNDEDGGAGVEAAAPADAMATEAFSLAEASRDAPSDRTLSSEAGDVVVPDVGTSETARDGGGMGDATDADAAGGSSEAGADAPSCTDACILGSGQCVSGAAQECKLQGACTEWVTTATCGTHQSCMATADAGATCTCNASICSQTGSVCQDGQTVATCAADTDGCQYVASTTGCTTPQSCSGMAPNATCSLTCTNSCGQGQASCVSGGLAKCALQSNGCWAYGASMACGTHQSCTGSAGAAQCTCSADPVCGASGNVCSNSSTLVSCAQDAQGCFYQASSTPCTNGACSGGQCCTNACTNGSTQCLSTSSTQIQSCSTGANGCTVWGTSACSSTHVCERYGTASCVDPQWAEWPMPSNLNYTDNGNGTVTDNITSLVWQQGAPNQNYTQAQAISYCASLNLGGDTDWRLPSLIELLSIVDPTKGDGSTTPPINATVFPGTKLSPYWTTTSSATTAGSAWYITFLDGSNGMNDTATLNYLRCVR